MPKRLTKQEVQERLDKNFQQKVKLISDYVNKRTPVQLECTECGHIWEAKPDAVIYSDYKHRCPNCGVKKGEWVKCSYCGKLTYKTQSELNNKTGFYYCSRTCGNRHKNELRFLVSDDTTNYRRKAFNFYPHKCAICGWDEDIRLLEVHHIDENHSNNQIENLCILCPTCHRKITLHYYKMLPDYTLVEND